MKFNYLANIHLTFTSCYGGQNQGGAFPVILNLAESQKREEINVLELILPCKMDYVKKRTWGLMLLLLLLLLLLVTVAVVCECLRAHTCVYVHMYVWGVLRNSLTTTKCLKTDSGAPSRNDEETLSVRTGTSVSSDKLTQIL